MKKSIQPSNLFLSFKRVAKFMIKKCRYSPWRCMLIVKVRYTHIKRAWGVLLSLVPRSEALALPYLSERATPKPTPYVYVHPNVGVHLHNQWASTVALFLTDSLELPDSGPSKQSAKSRLLYMCIVTHALYTQPYRWASTQVTMQK